MTVSSEGFSENGRSDVETAEVDSRVGYVFSKPMTKALNRYEAVKDRFGMVHSLIKGCGLLSKLKVIEPVQATSVNLKVFHLDEYVEFLMHPNVATYVEQAEDTVTYGLGYDCPVFRGFADTLLWAAGGTLSAARALSSGSVDISIFWGGGWHHALRNQAAGFCYINDVVLGIQQLKKKFPRVLYLDLDVHHGDGVESAFVYSRQVVTLSFHLHEVGFYPGSGSLGDKGLGRGKGYTFNVPLRRNISDENYVSVVRAVAERVKEVYQPKALVVQCGADTIIGDRLGGFNLTPAAICKCVSLFKSWKLPMLVLGGGGYHLTNTARTWAAVSHVLLDLPVPSDVPDHKYMVKYSPTFEMNVYPGMQRDRNSPDYVNSLLEEVNKQVKGIRLVQSVVAVEGTLRDEEYASVGADMDALNRSHAKWDDPQTLQYLEGPKRRFLLTVQSVEAFQELKKHLQKVLSRGMIPSKGTLSDQDRLNLVLKVTTFSELLEYIGNLVPVTWRDLPEVTDTTITTVATDDSYLFSEREEWMAYTAEELKVRIFEFLRDIRDPERPSTLEELDVISEDSIHVDQLSNSRPVFRICVTFHPTIPQCSLATLIGLCIRQKLCQELNGIAFKLDIKVEEGSHLSADDVTKQINDKERVAAALENPNLRKMVDSCIQLD
ncbi:unnamed protein product [Cyprideis torosa]|uniref:Histone deacetylase 8 n=1 Tax=Cyprideis torosa TaxID=163714 RepID=A0A7R8WDK6_9CRUS|nr:unnamed protein product [Cyprideis torosa]CAG0893288.1 unnamed protein product [Cyprideis torosa]